MLITPTLVTYLNENFTLDNFNSYIQCSTNKLSKPSNFEWLENKRKNFDNYRDQTINLINKKDNTDFPNLN